MSEKQDYRIEILDLAIDVLEILNANREKALGVSDISRAVGITKSRVFRILKTLELRDYVALDLSTQSYRLGLRLLELGIGVRQQFSLSQMAAPRLQELAQNTGEAVHLLVLLGHFAVCMDRYQGAHMLQGATPIGAHIPLHVGASPKLLLAFLPDHEREHLLREIDLPQFTPNTIMSRDVLRQRLEQISERGYSIDLEEYEVGVNAIGAPIRDHSGAVIAGVGLTCPTVRWSDSRKEDLVKQVVATAGRISRSPGVI